MDLFVHGFPKVSMQLSLDRAKLTRVPQLFKASAFPPVVEPAPTGVCFSSQNVLVSVQCLEQRCWQQMQAFGGSASFHRLVVCLANHAKKRCKREHNHSPVSHLPKVWLQLPVVDATLSRVHIFILNNSSFPSKVYLLTAGEFPLMSLQEDTLRSGCALRLSLFLNPKYPISRLIFPH